MKESNSFLNMILKNVLPLLILLGGGLAIFIVISMKEDQQRTKPEAKAPLVTTVPAQVSETGLVFEVDGVVVPYREIVLSAEVAGRVTLKKTDESGQLLDEGTYVNKGTVLLEIDPRKYDLKVLRLQDELEQADLNLQDVNNDIENTQLLLEIALENFDIQDQQYKRFQQLTTSRTVTQATLEKEKQALLTAKNQKLTLENQLRTLKTKLESTKQSKKIVIHDLEQAKIDASHTKVASPINGVIIKDYIEKDSYVQPGTKLYEIEDTSAVEVQCNLKMNELAWIWKSRNSSTSSLSNSDDYRLPQFPVTIVYRLGGHEYQWDGNLSRFAGIGLDESTRTAPVLVRVPEPNKLRRDGSAITPGGPNALLRGMYVQLLIHVDTNSPIWQIPEKALQPGNFVWLVVKNESGEDVLKRKDVQVIRRQGNQILIDGELNGFNAADQIVISPLAVSLEGYKVRVMQQSDQPQERSPSDSGPITLNKETVR